MTFTTTDQVRRAHQGYWFSPGARRFFRSRVSRNVWGGRYFISSEQFQEPNGTLWPRLYTIREASPTGDISTVGAFQAYRSRREALREIHRLLAS